MHGLIVKQIQRYLGTLEHDRVEYDRKQQQEWTDGVDPEHSMLAQLCQPRWAAEFTRQALMEVQVSV